MSKHDSYKYLTGALLALLLNQDLYAYKLTKQLKILFGASESTVYSILRELQQQGFLSTYDQPYAGRNRRYYHITKSGEAYLKKIQQDWQDFTQKMNNLFEGGY